MPDHKYMRYVVIALGDKVDPATDEDAQTVADLFRRRTGFICHVVSDTGIVNRITNHLGAKLGPIKFPI